MTYDEIVKELEKELGCFVHGLRVTEHAWACEVCGQRPGEIRLMYCMHPKGEPFIVCADRPACRARAERLRVEREQAVVEAVKL